MVSLASRSCSGTDDCFIISSKKKSSSNHFYLYLTDPILHLFEVKSIILISMLIQLFSLIFLSAYVVSKVSVFALIGI